MPTPVKVALIVCATVVLLSVICCGGLIILGTVMPPPAPVPAPSSYPTFPQEK